MVTGSDATGGDAAAAAMTSRDERLALQAQAREDRAAQDALSEARAAAEAMRDARVLDGATLLAMGGGPRGSTRDLLPERWAAGSAR